MKIIIEGIDNVGKDTQIRNIIKHFEVPFQVLHYYGCPIKNAGMNIKFTKKLYQDMFWNIKENDYVICNRSHLGETVYAPIYRSLGADWIFNLEKEYTDAYDDLILITIIDKAKNVIKRDDGLSLSTDKKQKKLEISMFKQAHEKSSIQNKLLININGKDEQEVKKEIINFIETIKG